MADPDHVTIPGAPEGFNCRMSARGYGSRLVRALAIGYSEEIGVSEDAGATTKSFYPLHRFVPSFTIRCAFLSWADREAFNAWMATYMRKVAGNQHVSGYMSVQCPARRFSRAGVPVGPLVYGEQSGQLTPPLDLGFVGAYDPVSGVGVKTVEGTSYYKAPSKDPTAATFYPAGLQKAGAESLEGTFYDPTPSTPSPDEAGEPVPVRQTSVGRAGSAF